MRHWSASSAAAAAAAAHNASATRARTSSKSPRTALSPLSPIISSAMSSAALHVSTPSDELSTGFASEWLHSSTTPLYSFPLHPHVPLPQIQSSDAMHFQQQQQQQQQPRISVVSGAPDAMGFHCPICLRVAVQAPIRQHCGHALCDDCTQQAMSTIGSCPLCRTQLLFGAAASVSSSNISAIGVIGSAMDAGFATPSEHEATDDRAAIAHTQLALQHQQLQSFQALDPSSPSLAVASDIVRELHSDSELSLQLDSLSDFGDMIDLPDLVASSDSEIGRRDQVAASSSAAAAGIVAVRKARVPRKKPVNSSNSSRSASVVRSASMPSTRTASTTIDTACGAGSTSTAAIGKKRKRKAPELVDASWTWTLVNAAGEPPAPRYDCGFAVHESLLLVVGGIVGNQRLNDLHVLDTSVQAPMRPSWHKPLCTGSPPPTGSLLQPFVVGDTLYVLGCTSDGKFLNELHAMDLRARKWEWQRLAVAGTPPSMRYWYSVAVLDGVAILFGGYGHSKRLGDAFALRLDLDVPTWMELQQQGDVPGPSSTHSVCVHEHRMYVFGGYDGKVRRSQLHALQLDAKTRDAIACTWTLVATLGRAPAPRYTHSSVCIGARMLVYGGNSGCLKGDLHILEFDSAELPTWKVVKCEHAPPPREWHRALALHGAMFVFGGHTADGNESALYRLAARPAL